MLFKDSDLNEDFPLEKSSDGIQEILSATPHGIVRWGNTVIFIILAALLYLSWYAQYPFTVSSRITVTISAPSSFMGVMSVSTQMVSTIKNGQIVCIQFDLYPYKEYGSVCGIVKSVSLIPNDSTSIVVVEFPNGLKTSLGKTLEFRTGLQGNADVITKKMRLIEWILPWVRSVDQNS